VCATNIFNPGMRGFKQTPTLNEHFFDLTNLNHILLLHRILIGVIPRVFAHRVGHSPWILAVGVAGCDVQDPPSHHTTDTPYKDRESLASSAIFSALQLSKLHFQPSQLRPATQDFAQPDTSLNGESSVAAPSSHIKELIE